MRIGLPRLVELESDLRVDAQAEVVVHHVDGQLVAPLVAGRVVGVRREAERGDRERQRMEKGGLMRADPDWILVNFLGACVRSFQCRISNKDLKDM